MMEEKEKRRLLLVSGMSGAGKSSVLRMLEDDGYFCVDNLPASFLMNFVQMGKSEEEPSHIAIGIDVRNGKGLEEIERILPELKALGVEILFLEASDESLVVRYKETRRLHPLLGQGRVQTAISLEREKLAFIKKSADYILDTSRFLTRELRIALNDILSEEDRNKKFVVTVLSFGFKYGIPMDADLVFDVRFLPNPFYVEELKPQTGNDKPVYDFVMASESAKEFLKKLTDLMDFLIPKYMEEGKTSLVLGIGCTGGKHRSVTLANALMKWFQTTEYSARIEHREI